MARSTEQYETPVLTAHGSFIARTLGNHLSGSVESTSGGGHNGDIATANGESVGEGATTSPE